jgi:ribosomal protein S18 acetylase RimI-like enzyme
VIRPYRRLDFEQLVEVYKSAFAEEPWNEYMKCKVCGVNYGKNEIRTETDYGRFAIPLDYLVVLGTDKNYFSECSFEEIEKCKKCNTDMKPERINGQDANYGYTSKNLVPFWSDEDVKKDLEFALTQEKPIVLVAGNNDKLVGFTWGYKTSLENFPFLEGVISNNSNYMDEIAVSGNARIKGIGTALSQEYIRTCAEQGIDEIVLRTDERNTASMTLFKKQGFTPVMKNGNAVYDPEYPQRIYLSKEVT